MKKIWWFLLMVELAETTGTSLSSNADLTSYLIVISETLVMPRRITKFLSRAFVKLLTNDPDLNQWSFWRL